MLCLRLACWVPRNRAEPRLLGTERLLVPGEPGSMEQGTGTSVGAAAAGGTVSPSWALLFGEGGGAGAAGLALLAQG